MPTGDARSAGVRKDEAARERMWNEIIPHGE